MKKFLIKLRDKCAKNRRAETVFEALISISVLLIISSLATGVYVTSVRSTAGNRNDLVAAALAEEGVELMRNIRDTNFLKYADGAQCWNLQPSAVGCPDAANLISQGSSTVWMDPADFSIEYLKQNTGLDTANLSAAGNAAYKLKLKAIAGAPNAKLYFHDAANEDTPFYRGLNISYMDFNADGINDAMKVISTVAYASATGKARTIVRAAILTNQKML